MSSWGRGIRGGGSPSPFEKFLIMLSRLDAKWCYLWGIFGADHIWVEKVNALVNSNFWLDEREGYGVLKKITLTKTSF